MTKDVLEEIIQRAGVSQRHDPNCDRMVHGELGELNSPLPACNCTVRKMLQQVLQTTIESIKEEVHKHGPAHGYSLIYKTAYPDDQKI